MILALRTDKPEAELYVYDNQALVDSYTWHAHRELSDTLLIQIEQLLKKQAVTLREVKGLIVFRGPGSFTGLRIGISVANSLAYALQVPLVGIVGEDWKRRGLQALQEGSQLPQIVLPEYGAQPNITKPRK